MSKKCLTMSKIEMRILSKQFYECLNTLRKLAKLDLLRLNVDLKGDMLNVHFYEMDGKHKHQFLRHHKRDTEQLNELVTFLLTRVEVY